MAMHRMSGGVVDVGARAARRSPRGRLILPSCSHYTRGVDSGNRVFSGIDRARIDERCEAVRISHRSSALLPLAMSGDRLGSPTRHGGSESRCARRRRRGSGRRTAPIGYGHCVGACALLSSWRCDRERCGSFAQGPRTLGQGAHLRLEPRGLGLECLGYGEAGHAGLPHGGHTRTQRLPVLGRYDTGRRDACASQTTPPSRRLQPQRVHSDSPMRAWVQSWVTSTSRGAPGPRPSRASGSHLAPNPTPYDEGALRHNGIAERLHSLRSVVDAAAFDRARRLVFVLAGAATKGPPMSVQPGGKPMSISTHSGFSVPAACSESGRAFLSG